MLQHYVTVLAWQVNIWRNNYDHYCLSQKNMYEYSAKLFEIGVVTLGSWLGWDEIPFQGTVATRHRWVSWSSYRNLVPYIQDSGSGQCPVACSLLVLSSLQPTWQAWGKKYAQFDLVSLHQLSPEWQCLFLLIANWKNFFLQVGLLPCEINFVLLSLWYMALQWWQGLQKMTVMTSHLLPPLVMVVFQY